MRQACSNQSGGSIFSTVFFAIWGNQGRYLFVSLYLMPGSKEPTPAVYAVTCWAVERDLAVPVAACEMENMEQIIPK